MNNDTREIMISFIKRIFKDKVRDDELQTDELIKKIYQEAINFSDWGL